MMPPSLEIHVPISPTPTFLNMVRCLTASLREFGGRYADAKVVVTVGDTTIDEALARRAPWLERSGVELRWLPETDFERDSYYATALQRFRYDHGSDVVLLMDADTLIAGNLSELVREVHQGRYLAGLIAHVSPFQDDDLWPELYDRCDLGPVRRPHEHTGWGYMDDREEFRFCPPYFNLGVLCMPAEVARSVGEVAYELMYAVNEVVETPFRCQLAVALAVVKLGLGYRALPMRYNFANDPLLEALHHREMGDVRIVHLLRRSHQNVNKWDIYKSIETIDGLLQRSDLRGINAMAQRILRTVRPRLSDPPTLLEAV